MSPPRFRPSTASSASTPVIARKKGQESLAARLPLVSTSVNNKPPTTRPVARPKPPVKPPPEPKPVPVMRSPWETLETHLTGRLPELVRKASMVTSTAGIRTWTTVLSVTLALGELESLIEERDSLPMLAKPTGRRDRHLTLDAFENSIPGAFHEISPADAAELTKKVSVLWARRSMLPRHVSELQKLSGQYLTDSRQSPDVPVRLYAILRRIYGILEP